jgi:hypothetical protein
MTGSSAVAVRPGVRLNLWRAFLNYHGAGSTVAHVLAQLLTKARRAHVDGRASVMIDGE